MIRFTFNRQRNETTSVPRDTRAPPALIHVFGQPAPTAFTTADFPTWSKEQLVPMLQKIKRVELRLNLIHTRPPAMMMPSGLGLPTQYYPPHPPHGYSRTVGRSSLAASIAPAAAPSTSAGTTTTPPKKKQRVSIIEIETQRQFFNSSTAGTTTTPPKKKQRVSIIEIETQRQFFNSSPVTGAKKAASLNKKKAAHNKMVAPNKKKAAPNKKKKKAKAIPLDQRRGRNFDAATTDCLSCGVSEKKAWKNLTAHCHKDPHLDCPILPSTMSNTLEEVLFMFCLHYPGDNDFDKMTDDGLLWLTQNGYYGEICLRFLSSTINNMIDQTNGIEGDCRDNIAFTDINMCPAPNNCGGDHNNPALQALTEDVLLIETIRLCPNANICFLGKKPNQYAKKKFFARLQKEGLANQFPEAFRMGSNSFASSYGYLPHSQFFYLMGFNTADHTRDLFRVVAFVIHAKFGTHINTDDENIQRMVLPFATQAMTDARREAMMSVSKGIGKAHGEAIKALWDDLNSVFNSKEYGDKIGEAIMTLWDDPNHVYNSTAYRAKLSKSHMGRRPKKTPARGGDDMRPCQFCAERYHIRKIGQHEKGCWKNPTNHHIVLGNDPKLPHKHAGTQQN